MGELRREDFGLLWEHYVLNELQATMQTREINYWRDKSGHEVDFVLAKMKVLTGGRFLWTRTIGSTIAGEAVDTLIFYPTAFAGFWSPRLLIQVMIANYLIKVGWEVVATPVTYKVVNFLKRAEREKARAAQAAVEAPPLEVKDLDALPMPARDALLCPESFSSEDMGLMITSRGCPYSCYFCHNLFGKKFRARSPENVLKEIDFLVKEYRVEELEIIDDAFNLVELAQMSFIHNLWAIDPRNGKVPTRNLHVSAQ
jgi:hypothetical protein